MSHLFWKCCPGMLYRINNVHVKRLLQVISSVMHCFDKKVSLLPLVRGSQRYSCLPEDVE